MDKRLKTGLIISGVAVAGYFAYTLLKKDPDEGLPATDPLASDAAYLNKVKELQKLIGVTADGVIGQNTKAALLKYGYNSDVNSGNVESALATVRAKVSASSTDASRYTKGLQILTFLKNKPGSIKFNSDVVANTYEKDAFGKFAKTGQTITFKAGNSFKPLYMINSTAGNTFGTGFKPGFMMFKIKRPLDFNYLFSKAPEFFVGPISSFSITVV